MRLNIICGLWVYPPIKKKYSESPTLLEYLQIVKKREYCIWPRKEVYGANKQNHTRAKLVTATRHTVQYRKLLKGECCSPGTVWAQWLMSRTELYCLFLSKNYNVLNHLAGKLMGKAHKEKCIYFFCISLLYFWCMISQEVPKTTSI